MFRQAPASVDTRRHLSSAHAVPSPKHHSVGFYGLDVYSLLESLESILDYIKQVDGQEAIRTAVRHARACMIMMVPPLSAHWH